MHARCRRRHTFTEAEWIYIYIYRGETSFSRFNPALALFFSQFPDFYRFSFSPTRLTYLRNKNNRESRFEPWSLAWLFFFHHPRLARIGLLRTFDRRWLINCVARLVSSFLLSFFFFFYPSIARRKSMIKSTIFLFSYFDLLGIYLPSFLSLAVNQSLVAI